MGQQMIWRPPGRTGTHVGLTVWGEFGYSGPSASNTMRPFIFLEHGRAPDPAVAAWQDRLTPIWKRIAGGCHLNRKIDDLIERAGFRIGDLRTNYLRGPRPMTYTYQGLAQLK
jgi:hypothetical protein